MISFMGLASEIFKIVPLSGSILSVLDLYFIGVSDVISKYVGVMEGQGTAYSIYLLNIENVFLPIIFFVLIC